MKSHNTTTNCAHQYFYYYCGAFLWNWVAGLRALGGTVGPRRNMRTPDKRMLETPPCFYVYYNHHNLNWRCAWWTKDEWEISFDSHQMTIFFEIQEVNVWNVNSQSIIVVIITAPKLGNPKLSDRMIWKGKTCGGDLNVQIQKLKQRKLLTVGICDGEVSKPVWVYLRYNDYEL